jgi:thioredoxin 1
MTAAALAWLCLAFSACSGSSPAPRITILFFTASWCDPCRAVEPVLHRFARKNDKIVKVVDVDFDQARDLVERWAVEEIPVTIVLSDRGELLLRANGASRQTLRSLESALNELLKELRKRSSYAEDRPGCAAADRNLCAGADE